MRIISLNAYGAAQGQIFFDFIKQQLANAEIFCFQEIFSAPVSAPSASSGGRMRLFEELEEILPEFKGVFCAKSKNYDFAGPVSFQVKHGLAVFFKKNLSISSSRVVQIAESKIAEVDPVEGVIYAQVLDFAFGSQAFSVINYHGPAQPGSKFDTPLRLAASEALKSLWEKLPVAAKILCGDFNLMPNTQSIKILEACGNNLIKTFNIQNTRNEISWKRYNNRQSFADYVFVSSAIKVKKFEVPYNLVSDHLPMILDFDL